LGEPAHHIDPPLLSKPNVLTIYPQAEWDKYFPIEQNTGELNVSDFDFAQFTGGAFSGPSIDLAMPSAQDLADVNFTPTFFPYVHKSSGAAHY